MSSTPPRELPAVLEDIGEICCDALDPELTREQVIAKVKEIEGLVDDFVANDDDDDELDHGDDDELDPGDDEKLEFDCANQKRTAHKPGETMMHIETHASSIYVREEVNGQWGDYALSELPAQKALYWAFQFIRGHERLNGLDRPDPVFGDPSI